MDLLPNETRIVYNLALLENSQGNTVKAEEYLLRALKTEPDNFDFLYAICTFYLEHKQNSKAAVYARRIMEKYPQNPAGEELLKAANQN